MAGNSRSTPTPPATTTYITKGGNLLNDTPSGSIEEGTRLGPLLVGADRNTIEKLLGPVTEEFRSQCGIITLHWNDIKFDNRGVYAFILDGKVFQLDTYSPRFSGPKIKVNGDLDEVKNIYPNLSAYELQNSATVVDGGSNLIFWIDPEKGIAFELYSSSGRGGNERQIGSISVFDVKIGFHPKGACKDSIQPLIEREKWFPRKSSRR